MRAYTKEVQTLFRYLNMLAANHKGSYDDALVAGLVRAQLAKCRLRSKHLTRAAGA